MSAVRIIARLDIKGPNLVKGIHLEGLRVLGKPEDFAEYYYQTGIDELLYMDVVASLYDRNSLHNIIEKTARNIFIPLTVGGGIRTIEDIKGILRAGADKVVINTSAIKNKNFIKEAAENFGSSTIIVAIEAIKQKDGRYLAYYNNGREESGLEVTKWAQEIEELGAGEILITSVDKEGTGKGFDKELNKIISDMVTIPVIIHGGAGKLSDITNAIKYSKPNAVSISSILHYGYIKNHKNLDGYAEGNLTFLNSNSTSGRFQTASVKEIKECLSENGIETRMNN